jgi:hypothetical protein
MAVPDATYYENEIRGWRERWESAHKREESLKLQLSEAKRLIKAMGPEEFCYHTCPWDTVAHKVSVHEATCLDIQNFMKA